MVEWFLDGSFGKGCFQCMGYMVIIGVCLVSAVSGSQNVIRGQLTVCEGFLVVCKLIGK